MYGPSLNIVQHRLTSSIDISSFGLRGAGRGRGRVLLGSINNYTSPCTQLHPGHLIPHVITLEYVHNIKL